MADTPCPTCGAAFTRITWKDREQAIGSPTDVVRTGEQKVTTVCTNGHRFRVSSYTKTLDPGDRNVRLEEPTTD